LKEKGEQLVEATRELKVLTSKPPLETASTQTLVAEYVSKHVLHRQAWHRFSAFVACTNCRGRPVALARSRDIDDKETDDAVRTPSQQPFWMGQVPMDVMGC
jgi:hypothetical protein